MAASFFQIEKSHSLPTIECEKKGLPAAVRSIFLYEKLDGPTASNIIFTGTGASFASL